MLKFRKINSKDFHGIYHDMLEQFPLSELKSYQTFTDLIDEGLYDVMMAEVENAPVGYCLVFKNKKYIFLDYIAVFKIRQGKGYGGEMLDLLRDYYMDKCGCFLEVEKPNPDDYNTLRRVRFYEMHGAEKINISYLYPNREGALPMDLYYIGYKPQIPPKEEIKQFIEELFENIHRDIPHREKVLAEIF